MTEFWGKSTMDRFFSPYLTKGDLQWNSDCEVVLPCLFCVRDKYLKFYLNISEFEVVIQLRLAWYWLTNVSLMFLGSWGFQDFITIGPFITSQWVAMLHAINISSPSKRK